MTIRPKLIDKSYKNIDELITNLKKQLDDYERLYNKQKDRYKDGKLPDEPYLNKLKEASEVIKELGNYFAYENKEYIDAVMTVKRVMGGAE